MLEAVHRGRALFEIAAGEVDLDGSGTHAEIVRVKRSHEQRIQALVELDSSPPAIDALHDLIVGPVVVIDGTSEQKLRLILWRHLVEAFNFMFREDVGRCRLRLPLQAQKLSDLLPGGARGAGTHKKRSQQDAGRYRCNRKPSASAAALGGDRSNLGGTSLDQ